jgi:hypothetical protein
MRGWKNLSYMPGVKMKIDGAHFLCSSPAKKKCLLIFLLFSWLSFSIDAQITEYEMKAVFLKNFPLYVEYPKECCISDTSKPFIIGVIGENPFGRVLKDYFATRKIRDKNVEIRNIPGLNDEISSCHLLFISASGKKHLHQILSATRKKPILTIGDTRGFAEQGVLINFYMDSGRVRFEINHKAVKESGLHINFRLLNLAKIVEPVETGL